MKIIFNQNLINSLFMKRIKYYSLLIMISIYSFSCNKTDSLNPIPTTLIADASAFETSARISNQINGLYATFKGTGLWGSAYILYSEARAGEFISTNQNPLQGGLTYMMLTDPGTSDVNLVWQQAYQTINACNVFLDGMDAQGKKVVGDTLYSNYTAEAKVLRAVTYYSLLQLYARPYRENNGKNPGLPLRLKGNTGLDNYNLARSSVDEVYKQILADLNYAETNLPAKYATAALNTTRVQKNTAIALKTRVYLAMGDYTNVVNEANKIVSTAAPFVTTNTSNTTHSLPADITTVFKTPYTSTESIFSIAFASGDAPGNSLASNFLPNSADGVGLGSAGTGQFYVFSAGIASDVNWKTTDKRRSFIFTTASGTNKGRLWCSKFAVGTPYTDYIPVIRYSEVLLNLAEALANLNGLDARSIAILNAVRGRSDATTIFKPTDKADLLSKIITERRIEFFGEGVRNGDLMRLGLPIPAKTPVGSTPVPASNPTDGNYIWPIPNNESLYNKLI